MSKKFYFSGFLLSWEAFPVVVLTCFFINRRRYYPRLSPTGGLLWWNQGRNSIFPMKAFVLVENHWNSMYFLCTKIYMNIEIKFQKG